MKPQNRLGKTKVTFLVRKGDDLLEESIVLGDLFHIDDTNISNEFARQAGLYAFFAVQMAHAEEDKARAIAEKDEAYGITENIARDVLNEENDKVTEPMVKAYILRDDWYISHVDAVLEADLEYKKLRALCKALEMRATMLQSLGSHLRHELGMTDMNIRDRQYQAQLSDVRKVVTDARARKRKKK